MKKIFNTQYKALLTVLATFLILVLCVLWFFDRRDERNLQEHLFELPPAARGNVGAQGQQGPGSQGIF